MDAHHILVIDIIRINPQIFFWGYFFKTIDKKKKKCYNIYVILQKGEKL